MIKKILLILSTILACAFAAQAKLNVIATLPDFGSLAREIGGDKIDIIVLAKATEDPHFVDARPSFVVSLRNADALIDGGAELELGWLPPLLQNARNPKIEVGKPGRIQASQGIRLMNVPTTATRAAGDVHALGNPHFTVDPIIAKAIAQMKAQHVKAVIVEPYHDRRIAEKVASATGAKVVEFSQFPGGIPGTDTYVKLIDTLISRLVAALK